MCNHANFNSFWELHSPHIIITLRNFIHLLKQQASQTIFPTALLKSPDTSCKCVHECACFMCIEKGCDLTSPPPNTQLLQSSWQWKTTTIDWCWTNFSYSNNNQLRSRNTERMKCSCGFWTGNCLYHEAGAVPVTAETCTPPIFSSRFAVRKKKKVLIIRKPQ